MEQRLRDLDETLRRDDYKGWDPFDLPNAPLFARLPVDWQLPQLVVSKTGSRLMPHAGRRLLRVPLIEDVKTYSCAYFGYRYGGLEGFAPRAELMVDRIAGLARADGGGGGRAWGYDFVWPTRASGVNARSASTIVPGSFAALTLLHHHADTGDRRHLALAEEALGHYAGAHACENASGPFLGYFKAVDTNTHNANLLGCAALTLGAHALGRDDWARLAAAAATTSIRAVRADGYLEYADKPSGDWTDCFHHLYVIACASAVAAHNPHVDRELFTQAIDRLCGFARQAFLRPDGAINYFPGKLHPIDPHNYAATAVFGVLAGLGPELGEPLLRRVDAQMWDPRTRTYAYKKHPRRIDRRAFLRWTHAWMFGAIAMVRAREEVRGRWRLAPGTSTETVTGRGS
jgi:hypothetical protein